MHKYASYITLTYAGKQYNGASLHYRDFQLFMKSLRKKIWLLGREYARLIAQAKNAKSHFDLATALATLGPGENQNRLPSLLVDFVNESVKPIRFYAAGEYGETYGRPHWHALLFGVDFSDKKLHKQNHQGDQVYTSSTLSSIWKHGFSTVGNLTFESAAYVARYVMKKHTGDGDKTNYKIIDPETGEIHIRKKEFNTMSRRSGIGASWMEKYAEDVYSNTGKVIMRGGQHFPPRYYDKLYKKIDAAALEHHKHVRYLEALAQKEHHSPERLAVQEEVALARTRSLKRNLTNGD